MGDFVLKLGRVSTSHGALTILMDRDPKETSRPVVVVLHGALRHSENTRAWVPVLTDRFDVVLVDLPGHGYTAPDGEPSIRSFTARVGEMISRHFSDRDVVIVGESVGGLLAFGLADGRVPCIKGIIATDPPLTTAKLWPVFNNFLRPKSEPLSDFITTFYANTFGYFASPGGGGGIGGDRIYYSLVQNVAVPTLILTGDLPLFPVRPVADNVPCLMDNVDKTVIGAFRNPHVSIETIKGAGHLCLDPKVEQARNAVVDFCTTHLYRSAVGSAAAAAE